MGARVYFEQLTREAALFAKWLEAYCVRTLLGGRECVQRTRGSPQCNAMRRAGARRVTGKLGLVPGQNVTGRYELKLYSLSCNTSVNRYSEDQLAYGKQRNELDVTTICRTVTSTHERSDAEKGDTSASMTGDEMLGRWIKEPYCELTGITFSIANSPRRPSAEHRADGVGWCAALWTVFRRGRVTSRCSSC